MLKILYGIHCLSLGHIHLSDFNIATWIPDGKLATSVSGTKPYMGTIMLYFDFKILKIKSCYSLLT